MSVKVCKHGNSLSIRLGAHIAHLANLKAGDYVNVRLLDSGDIQVSPVKGLVAANAPVGAAPLQAPVREQW
jgi:antitoxin component of MazEF toxin-antitoxin module